MRSNYAKSEFWDERYQKANTYYDWLMPYMGVADQQGMRDWMIDNVDCESKILIVGCGISRMPIEMFEDGYENLTMIDRSQWAIRFQMEHCKYPQDLPFHCMDVRDMSVQKDGSGFKDGQFDYVIDKAVLDSVICGPNLCKKDELSVTEQMLTEIHRVLKPTGAYICISHGAEIHRKKFLKDVHKYNWKYKKHYIPKVNPKGPPKLPAKGPQGDDKKLYIFAYVCRKQTEEVFDSSDEEIINMFKPKFAFDSEKLDGDFITIKEEQLPDDPSDDSHPSTKSNVYDASQVQGPVKQFADNNWAWKFKYIDPQSGKNAFQQFSDVQCISIEFIYQKYLLAKQLGYYETKRMRKGEYIKMPDDYEIFPIDAAFTVDLRHMIMYENKQPKNFFRIYRSVYNQRCKPTHNILVEPGSPRNKPKIESALAALVDDKKTAKFKDADANGFYRQPYRPKSSGASREDLRNQFGKMFLKKNNFKQPSLNQLVNGLILTNLDILKEQGVNYHNYHLDQAYTQYKMAFDKLMAMTDLGDPDKPLDVNILRFDSKHPITQTVMYLYSLEPPFYRHINRACREKDMNKIDKVGPFAAALGEIVRNQDPFREDRQQAEFKVYRGLTLPDDEIEGLKYILKDIKKARDAFATGDNLNFKELLARQHAPVAQDVRELSQWFVQNSYNGENTARFFAQFLDALGMAAVTNQLLEEQMEALFAGILTVLKDYSSITAPEGNYNVDSMKKKFEGWKIKDFKKNWPGGDTALWTFIIDTMNNFDISKYYKDIQPAIMADLKNYTVIAFDIPIEEQTGDKGRKSLLWKMIPWLKKVMEYLQMNEQTVKEQLIAQRKGKEFDIKEHTFHLEGFTSTSFERKVAEEFACKWDFPGKKSVIYEYTIKVDNNRYPGFQLNKPQFTAYPEENEFLLLDGADCLLKDIKDEFVPGWNKQAVVIEMEQINDWPHMNPPGGKGKKGGGKKKGKKK